jgi:diguanylate cyclase (GGDEF)-like protein
MNEMVDRAPSLLIVDDIAANREILARRFLRRGFQITEADCGRRALELVEQQSFDVVLLDVMMPDLGGLDVLKAIRNKHSNIALPVIMVTAKSEGTDVAEALAAGANDYVTKPVDFVVALARTNTQLALKRAEEASRRANEALEEMNKLLEQRISERTAELVHSNEHLKAEIMERERSQAEAHYLAHHDPLTGLGNRTFLRQHLNQVLARVRRTGESLAILFIDLDGFKSINDTLGHLIGDALLKTIGHRLRENLRDTDEIARLGGDEFAVVQVGHEQPKNAAGLAARLIEIVNMPCEADGHQLQVGASIGIAIACEGKLEPDQLLKSADLAMYRAKADGRGTYRFFEPDMDERAQARRALEVELRNAVTHNSFVLHYQPLVDLTKNRVSAVEALLRWPRPNGGAIPPSIFIPVAEELGLIVPLGAWVLRRACADAVNWPDHVTVCVNLSSVQFKNGALLRTVLDALAESGLPARRLELEITESVLLDKSDVNLAVLNKLREHGVRVALDDFGTGYSSLSYLRLFHFDKIKVDQSFIRDLGGENNSHSIVRAVADIGSSFGMTTTAEGVETEEQLKWLRREGYAEVQGYLFGRPSPASQIPGIIENIAQGKSMPAEPLSETKLLEHVAA